VTKTIIFSGEVCCLQSTKAAAAERSWENSSVFSLTTGNDNRPCNTAGQPSSRSKAKADEQKTR